MPELDERIEISTQKLVTGKRLALRYRERGLPVAAELCQRRENAGGVQNLRGSASFQAGNPGEQAVAHFPLGVSFPYVFKQTLPGLLDCGPVERT